MSVPFQDEVRLLFYPSIVDDSISAYEPQFGLLIKSIDTPNACLKFLITHNHPRFEK